MAESTKFEYGDTEYTEIYNEWVANGSPNQFDYTRDSDYGGSLIRVIDRTATYPDFYRALSLPAATWDDQGKVQWKGRWPGLNESYEKIELRYQEESPTRPAITRITYVDCPNELE